MSLTTAQSFALNLARTMMTIILVIETSSGFSVVACDEFDSDPQQIVREYDPFA